MELWYFQKDAVDSVYNYFMAKAGNPVIAMPTGTGKSVVIGSFIHSMFDRYPQYNHRVLMLTHVKELIAQNYDKLLRIWPTAPAGIFSAGLKRKEIAPITYAGIGSAANAVDRFAGTSIIVIDEAHRLSPKEDTQYQRFIAQLKESNPMLKVVGLSATPFRLSQGYITDGGLFTDICFNNTQREDFNKLIAEGYLAPLIPKKTSTELNVDGVHKVGGEYNARELQLATNIERVSFKAMEELVAYANYDNRCSWLIFTTGIEHAESVARILREQFYINAQAVHSKMKDAHRDICISEFKAGRIRCLVNNNVLTTGFDHPHIDLIGVLRPTLSPGLWVQMLGRGTRIAPAKHNCLVLDFAGNTRRLGPINDPLIPKAKGKTGGMAPVRVCDTCSTYNHASARTCICCGAEFPTTVKFVATADTAELIRDTLPVVETHKVDRVTYQSHQKHGGLLHTMRVNYFCNLRMFQEWICFEHDGLPQRKAHAWWRQRAQGMYQQMMPETVAEALTQIRCLKTPTSIKVWTNRKYPEVINYEFDGGNGEELSNVSGSGTEAPGATSRH